MLRKIIFLIFRFEWAAWAMNRWCCSWDGMSRGGICWIKGGGRHNAIVAFRRCEARANLHENAKFSTNFETNTSRMLLELCNWAIAPWRQIMSCRAFFFPPANPRVESGLISIHEAFRSIFSVMGEARKTRWKQLRDNNAWKLNMSAKWNYMMLQCIRKTQEWPSNHPEALTNPFKAAPSSSSGNPRNCHMRISHGFLSTASRSHPLWEAFRFAQRCSSLIRAQSSLSPSVLVSRRTC